MGEAAFRERLAAVAADTEAALDALLAEGRNGRRPPRLMAAMRHAAMGGGKRLRPFLAVETARALGGDPGEALAAGLAVELVHCYSLVHDDLPSMDNDDLRRGKPTVHRAFDEATAILAGDGLLTLAFEVLADASRIRRATTRAGLVLLLAQGAGIDGMVGGQQLDLTAEGRFGPAGLADEAGVVLIQGMKTGALIRAACEMGAVVAGAKAARRRSILRYAEALGLAFQIKDDLLDVESDAASLGKATGKDAEAGKSTFVSLLGVAGARKRLAEVTGDGELALAGLGPAAEMLAAALRFNSARVS
jgi:farnesyl diphosphate synthase